MCVVCVCVCVCVSVCMVLVLYNYVHTYTSCYIQLVLDMISGKEFHILWCACMRVRACVCVCANVKLLSMSRYWVRSSWDFRCPHHHPGEWHISTCRVLALPQVDLLAPALSAWVAPRHPSAGSLGQCDHLAAARDFFTFWVCVFVYITVGPGYLYSQWNLRRTCVCVRMWVHIFFSSSVSVTSNWCVCVHAYTLSWALRKQVKI